jgi:polyvinyl alcohol dehydrogenase (cytochrome)
MNQEGHGRGVVHGIGRRKLIKSLAMAGALAAVPPGLRSPSGYARGQGRGVAPGVADWPRFGYDLHNTRFNANEKTLGKSNVGSLQLRWTRETNAPIQTVPTVIGDTLYFGTMAGDQYALETSSGEERWNYFAGYDFNSGANPGVRSSSQFENGRIYFGTGLARVHCLDAATGREIWQTQIDEDPVRNRAQILCSPVVFRGKVYIGTSSAQAQAACLDAETGAIRWRFYVVPDRSRDAGGSIWTSAAVDEETNIVYFTTGSLKSFMPPDPMLFTESVLAFDGNTGEMIWYDQARRADPFDLDYGCHPMIFDAVHPAQPEEIRKCVGAGNKAGFYCFNRHTGERYWKTMLTPAGAGSGLRLNATAVAYNRVIVVSNVGGVPGRPAMSVTAALHAYTGDILWWVANSGTIVSPVSIANRVFYQGLENGSLEAIDVDTGEELWSQKLPKMIRGGVSVANGWIYSPTGTMQGWRKDTASPDERYALYAFSPGSP